MKAAHIIFALFRAKYFLMLMLFTCLTLFLLNASALAASPSAGFSYDNGIVSEDVTWRGNVVINGSLTIASQATVRIEPGTRVQVISASKHQLSRLVVMGRIQALGSADSPVLFTSGNARWGGILLLSSMKKNHFEHCRIEKAELGIEARFSSVTTSKTQVSHAKTGFALYDSVASSSSDTITKCVTAYSSTASEVEMKNSTVTDNQDAVILVNSSAVITGSVISKNNNRGISINKSRLTMLSSTLSGNGVGFESQSGEGEIRLCRFWGNRVAGLKLADSPLKISRSQILDNVGDGISLQDARTTLWGNVLYGNGHSNLSYSGRESFSAVQNWWGSTDERVIEEKVSITYPEVSVMISPWLMERPPLP